MALNKHPSFAEDRLSTNKSAPVRPDPSESLPVDREPKAMRSLGQVTGAFADDSPGETRVTHPLVSKIEKRALDEQVLDRAPRIIVKFHDWVKLHYRDHIEDELARFGIDWTELSNLAQEATLKVIYRQGELSVKAGNIEKLIEQLIDQARKRNPDYQAPNFWAHFVLEQVPADLVEPVLKMLRSWPAVEYAYLQSVACEPATGINPSRGLQEYLSPAPTGINAYYAWMNGGDGTGQDFVDVERGWHLDHEDLVTAQGVRRASLLSHPGTLVAGAISHGTNTLGVVSATDNNIGVVGIAPQLRNLEVISYGMAAVNIPQAIQIAAQQLTQRGPGGVLLLEVQLLDQNNTCWPVEIDDTIFDAISLATQAGVVVIEPAGNGQGFVGQSLDNYLNHRGQRIFDRAVRDSGAIMVGAGERFPAAAGSALTWQRAGMSNYGNRVDCFAWGDAVWTTDASPGVPYTGAFGATSGASAIIAGAALALQGMAQGSVLNARLSPAQVRDWLSDTTIGVNTPTVSAGDLIGVMPDLERIGITRLGLPAFALNQVVVHDPDVGQILENQIPPGGAGRDII